jgi:outer membrane protein insertion porin family
VVDHYHAKGYLDCKLTPTPKFDESTMTVNYDVAIEPGPVYHLGFVKFDNVSDELRTYLIRNWQMLPGDPFNETYVANFIASVQKNDPVLRRSLAGIKTTFDAVADPQTHDVNVVIRLAKQ